MRKRFVTGIVKYRADDDSALGWKKSSLSYANGNCVEVGGLSGDLIMLRDSKDVKGPVLRFTPDEWDAFLGGVRNGEFDRTRGTGL